jgi:5-methylcytosine-specific restriction endonuclease McrA
MARHVLGGPVDAGRASYQVELTLCESCQKGWQYAHGEAVDVTDEMASMARCDAQHLAAPHADQAHPVTHVGNEPKRRTRAKQDVPPALRREVTRRDRRCCVVPGCRHRTFLDLHHILTREEGGAHDAGNLITLCGAHHRAVHHGELRIEGRVSTGIRYFHADGTDYGDVSSIAGPIADAQTKTFQALRQLGFAEREAKQALSEVLADPDRPTTVESILRAALQRLAAAAFQRAS